MGQFWGAFALFFILNASLIYWHSRHLGGSLNLERAADTLLIAFYNSESEQTAENLSYFVKVNYLDLCNRYGLPVSQVDKVVNIALALFQPLQPAKRDIKTLFE